MGSARTLFLNGFFVRAQVLLVEMTVSSVGKGRHGKQDCTPADDPSRHHATGWQFVYAEIMPSHPNKNPVLISASRQKSGPLGMTWRAA